MNKKVEAELSEETIKKIEYLEKVLRCNNRADAVAAAVRIAECIVSSIEGGGKIALEYDGKACSHLKIPGL